MATKPDRIFIISLGKLPPDHFLPGDKVKVKVKIVDKNTRKTIGPSLRKMPRKTVTVSCPQFEGPDVAVALKYRNDRTARLKPDDSVAGQHIEVTLEDFPEVATDGQYTAEWGEGFASKGSPAAKGDTAESEKPIQKPWAKLSYRPPSAKKPLRAGQNLKVSVQVEAKLASDTEIKFEGDALESPPQTQTFKRGSKKQDFELPLSSKSNIAKPTVKIAEFGPHDLSDPGNADHPTEIEIDFRTWKIEFTAEPENITNGTTDFYRGDTAKFKVAFVEDGEAEEADTAKIEILHENGKAFCPAVEFSLTKEAEVEIPLTPDHRQYPITTQKDGEGLTFKISAAGTSKHLFFPDVHAEKELALKRFSLSLAEDPQNQNQEHGESCFLADTVDFTIKMPATAGQEIKGELRFHIPGPDQPKTTEHFYYPRYHKYPGTLEPHPFTIPAGQAELETKVPIELKMAGQAQPLTEEKTLTVAVHIQKESYAFVDARTSILSNFTLSALPVVRFHEGGPVVGRSPIQDSGESCFKLSTGIPHKVKLSRTDAYKDVFESEVKIVGDELQGEVLVTFGKGELIKEAEIVLKDSAKFVKKPVGLESVKNCLVVDEGRTINVLGAEDYLFRDEDWLFPAGLPAAPGDQVWIQLTKDGIEEFDGDSATFAKLSCEAFEEDEYDVIFKKGERESQIVSKDPGTPEKGIRIAEEKGGDALEEKDYPITITPVPVAVGGADKTCKFDGAGPNITVRKRFGFFSQKTDIDNMTSGMTDVPITVNLNHPARTNTRFVITGNYCKNAYKIGFKPGQDTLTFPIDLDQDPAPPDIIQLELEAFSGNICDPPLDAEEYPKILEPKDVQRAVGFDKTEPVIGTVVYTGSAKVPTFHSEDAFKLKVVLDEPAVKEAKVKISCEAFHEYDTDDDPTPKDKHEIELTFNPGDQEKETEEVQIRNIRKKSATIRLVPEPENSNLLITDTPGYSSTLDIRIKKLPDIRFDRDVLDPDEGWIDPMAVPFMVDEQADVYVSLNEAHKGAKPITGNLVSPVIEKKYPFTIQQHNTKPDEYPIRVKFAKASKLKRHRWGQHALKISLDRASSRRCFKSDQSKQIVSVFEKRHIFFHGKDPIDPRGPFVKDEEAKIRIQLDHPAGKDRASAELEGPFDIQGYVDENEQITPVATGKKIEIPYLQDGCEVMVKFNADSEAKDNVTLANPVNCEFKDGINSITVLVKEPEVLFDQEAWDALEDPDRALVPGGVVSLPFKLKDVCPASGCHLTISCDAFAANSKSGGDKKYTLEFSSDRNRFNRQDGSPIGNQTTINVPIDRGFEVPETKKVTIEFSDPHQCKGPASPIEIQLPEPPTVSFAKTDYSQVYEAGKDKETLTLKATIAPEQDIVARIKSKAFGAKVYVVKIPQGSTAEHEVEVSFVNGEQDPEANKSEVTLVPPAGWVAGNTLELKVKVPQEPEMVQHCARPEPESTTEEGEEEGTREGTGRAYPEDTCNLRRLLLTVRHGNHQEKAIGRGPYKDTDKDGTFEIVQKAECAEHPGKALVCKGYTAPIIQVTGGRPEGDPNVQNYPTSRHYTEVVVGLDQEDKFCPPEYVFNDKAFHHPFVFFYERSLKDPKYTDRDPLEETYGHLLEPVSDPHAPSIYVRRMDEDLRYEWAPLLPEPTIDCSVPDNITTLPAYCAYQPIDETLGKIDERLERIDEDMEAETSRVKRIPKRAKRGVIEYFKQPLAILRNLRRRDVPQQYLIEAQCCGIPDLEKPYEPAKNLRAVVEVFPGDEYCFFLGLGGKGDTVMEHMKEGTFIGAKEKTNLLGQETVVRREFNPEREFNLEGLIKSAEEIEAERRQVKKKAAFTRKEKDVLGKQEETPADFSAKMNLTINKVEGNKCFITVNLKPPLKVDARVHFISEALDPETQKGLVAKESEEGEVELTLKDPLPENPKLGFDPFLGYETDTGDRELDLQAGATTATGAETEEAEEEVETAENETAAAEERGKVFHSRLVNPEGAEPESFDGVEHSSRVFYPYESGEALSDFEFEHDDWSYEAETSGTDKWDWTESEDDKTSSEALDKMISKACLTKLADLRIHLGINGKQQEPEINERVRKGLYGGMAVLFSIVDLLNKLDNEAGAGYGFGVGFKLTFLKGHFARYWGWKECSDYRAFSWNYYDIDMHIIGIQAEIFFGVGYGFCGKKIEAVIFGSIQGDLNLAAVLEKNEPAVQVPVEVFEQDVQQTHAKSMSRYFDGWAEIFTEAKLGARAVLGDEAWFSIEAAIKTGFTFRTRVLLELGVDLETYFNGLSATLEVHFLAILEWTGEKTIIKGNVAGWPAWTYTFGGSGERRLTEVNRSIAQVQARIDFMRRRFESHLLKYQEVQVLMVADKKIPVKGEHYPFTILLPGYGFEEGEAFASEEDWRKNKREWDRQWTLCQRAFYKEDKRVPRRTKFTKLRPKVNLKDRLPTKVRGIERIAAEVIMPRLRALDLLEHRLHDLQKRVGDFLNKSVGDFDKNMGDAFYDESERLKKDPAISYRNMNKGKLTEFGGLVEDLVHYAKFREKW